MKNFLVYSLLFLSSQILLSQALPVHEKKIYVAPDGKMYINKALPVYLRIATSPDENAKNYLLRSEQSVKYSNPLYFDTEGYNTVRTPSCVDTVTKVPLYPQQDIIFEVYTDSKAPVTTLNFGGSKTSVKKGKTYVNGSIEIRLIARDETSGVEKIYFSVDGESFKPYDGQLKLDKEKEYDLKYYSVDNVGNAEALKSIILVIDISKPVTSYEIQGDLFDNVLSSRSKIILKSEDGNGIGTESVFYKLDDGTEKKYTAPISGVTMSQGEHVLSFYSKDNVSNTEDIKTFTFYVDKTPPVVVQEIIGKSFFAGGKEYSSGRSQLKFTSFDNKAGVKEIFYSVNGSEYKKYEKPFFLSNSAGNLTVMAYATDNVNNKTESIESGDKTSIPYVDLTGPSVKHGFSGPVFTLRDSVYISAKTKILLTANDSESGLARIEYSVDGQPVQDYSAEFSISQAGRHKIEITGYDNVENTSNSEFVVVVDNTGPEIFSRFSINSVKKTEIEGQIIEEYPSHAVLFFSSTDGVVGFDQMFYSLNGTPEKKYAGLINSFPKKGVNNVNVRAIDKLGNETTATYNFAIGD